MSWWAQARILAAAEFPAQGLAEVIATVANAFQCFKMTLVAELNCLVSWKLLYAVVMISLENWQCTKIEYTNQYFYVVILIYHMQ